jgi:hypothetical protein
MDKNSKTKKINKFIEYFFGEDQGRYILEIDPKNLQKLKKYLKIIIFIMKILVILKKITLKLKVN